MSEGYRALRETAGLLDLDARGRIRITGEDRARLLHAMSTNHVQQLKPGEGCYTFFLSAQGRILADAALLCHDEFFLADVEPETHAALMEHLDKFIIADDVTLEDARADFRVIGLEGPESDRILTAAGLPAPAEPYHHAAFEDGCIARLDATGAGGFRIFVTPEGRDALWDRLRQAGAVEATAAEANVVRLEHGRPRYGEDITERYLVQEVRQMHAVHSNKGCYIGQEIVERVRARGQVHRLLTPLWIEGETAPAKGEHFKAGEADAGELTSAAYSPAEGKVAALGYVRAEYAKPGQKLAIGGAEAIVR